METTSSPTAPSGPADTSWQADPDLVSFVAERLELRLGNYERIPDEVRDHHETEIEALAGGYSYHQVLELVQNAADAILEHTASTGNVASSRIVLQLFDKFRVKQVRFRQFRGEGIFLRIREEVLLNW